MLFTSYQARTTRFEHPPALITNSYTSNRFKYSSNKHIFSHLEIFCFAYPAKLHPLSASHRTMLWLWETFSSPSALSDPQAPPLAPSSTTKTHGLPLIPSSLCGWWPHAAVPGGCPSIRDNPLSCSPIQVLPMLCHNATSWSCFSLDQPWNPWTHHTPPPANFHQSSQFYT